MPSAPADTWLDATIAMRRDPYRYISRRAKELGSDVFETRLLLRRTLCMTGPQAPEVFYDANRFIRDGASPLALQRTLFGEGGVQGLDGQEHAHRKRMFLSIFSRHRIDRLAERTVEELRRASRRWQLHGAVQLYPAMQEVLTGAACRWAGVTVHAHDLPSLTRDLTALFDAAGSFGPEHLRARRSRKRCEHWAARAIERARVGPRLYPLPSDAARSPVQCIATHVDLDGRPLGLEVAAVELLNLLRPIVAISVYFVFLVHAIEHHREQATSLIQASDADRRAFVHEVRRSYPFFPAVPAIVRRDFEWAGIEMRAGTRALLDLYGIDHDERLWKHPDAFEPERFRARVGDAFSLVPQGGGDHEHGHRCAGEWATIALMLQALHFFVRELRYTVPQQDLELDMRRLPALPKAGLLLRPLALR